MFLFQYFTKNIPILDSFIKNIFNTYVLKRYVWFLHRRSPTQQYFFHLSKKSPPAIMIRSHMEEKQSMFCLLIIWKQANQPIFQSISQLLIKIQSNLL